MAISECCRVILLDVLQEIPYLYLISYVSKMVDDGQKTDLGLDSRMSDWSYWLRVHSNPQEHRFGALQGLFSWKWRIIRSMCNQTCFPEISAEGPMTVGCFDTFFQIPAWFSYWGLVPIYYRKQSQVSRGWSGSPHFVSETCLLASKILSFQNRAAHPHWLFGTK